MLTPKVTVLMAVYNGARFIEQAIMSVLQQSFTDFEFIIIDDGSIDETPAIIARFSEQDQRIVSIKNDTNIGLTKSLNRGLALARGTYVARMDADDISLPNRLNLQVNVLENSPNICLVSGHIEIIDEDGRIVHRPKRSGDPLLTAWYLVFFNYLGGHSQVMFRREMALDEKGYAENRPYGQDYELWLRLALRGDILIIPETILQWRKHGEGISSQMRLEQDAYSLIDSGRAIMYLQNKPLSLADIVRLREFWFGRFPNPRHMVDLSNQLSQICEGFLLQRGQLRIITQSDARLLSRVIARQFCRWAYVLLMEPSPLYMVRALGYSAWWRYFGWHEVLPQATLKVAN